MLNINTIKNILNQFGGPIKFSYQTTAISNITENIVQFHIDNIEKVDEYTINDLFSLYAVLDYALKDLGDDEFNTVTGLDLLNDGYKNLIQVGNMLRKS